MFLHSMPFFFLGEWIKTLLHTFFSLWIISQPVSPNTLTSWWPIWVYSLLLLFLKPPELVTKGPVGSRSSTQADPLTLSLWGLDKEFWTFLISLYPVDSLLLPHPPSRPAIVCPGSGRFPSQMSSGHSSCFYGCPIPPSSS